MATTTFHRFLDLPVELRLKIYEFIPTRINFAVARRDEYGTPVIIFVRTLLEPNILRTCKTVLRELEPGTKKCGPSEMIVNCEIFEQVPDVIEDVRNAHGADPNNPLRLKDVERAMIPVVYTNEQHDEEAEDDAVMNEMWIRLANVYLKHDMRLDIGILIGQDSDVCTLLPRLETAADHTVDLLWSLDIPDVHPQEFNAVLECGMMENPDDVERVVKILEAAEWDVVRSLGEAEKKMAWGVEKFEGVFEMTATDYDGVSV
jgi:hypothetical protein